MERSSYPVINWSRILWQVCCNCTKNTMFWNETLNRFSCKCKNPGPTERSKRRMYKLPNEIKKR